jgi:signal transduction histidine kinase
MAKPIRILLVEDSEDDALLLERHLKKSGFDAIVTRVDSLADLKKALRSGCHDIILSDYNLPGFNGFAVIEEMRSTNLDLPAIIISGAVGEEVAAQLMRMGASDFIRKENLSRLAVAIDRELIEFGNRRARQRAEKALNETLEALQRANEELKHAIDARDDFLASASHELRTPITSLRLQFDLARRSINKLPSVPPEVSRFFRVADGQIGRLVVLIDTLLDFALIQAGRLRLNLELVDLGEVVKSAIEREAEQLKNAGNTLELDLSEELIGIWDRSRLEQVLAHLLSNASKYAPGVKIRIEARHENGKVRLIVHDYGDGIPKEEQDKIFERFQRLHPVSHISGLGLGLFISRALVQAQGGKIWVESIPHEGSLFVLELPQKKAA